MNELKPSRGTGMSRTCSLLFGVIWILLSSFFLLSALGDFLGNGERSWFTMPFMLCSFVLVVIGLGITAASIIPWIAGMRVRKPEVAISSTSLRVGDGFTLTYSQTFKQKTEVEDAALSLILRERATYQQGTQTRTVTHERAVEEFQYPGRIFEPGDQLSFSRGMKIPRGDMHTFRSRHNQIAWLLRVKVDFPGWPDYREDFDIRVRPYTAR